MAGVIASVHSQSLLRTYVSPAQNMVVPVQGFLGSASKSHRLPAPCAIWIPTGAERYEGPNLAKLGGGINGGFNKVLCTRVVAFDVHLHCELTRLPTGAADITDFATAEDLLTRFISSLHRALSGPSCTFTGGSWKGQAPGDDQIQDRKVYVLSMEVRTPVMEPSDSIVYTTISGVPVSAGITTATNPPK